MVGVLLTHTGGGGPRSYRSPKPATPVDAVKDARSGFFRLSRYQDALLELLEADQIRIEPEQRRNEAISLVRGGLEDFSVSRSRERARRWGIQVPGDSGQVIYVWFDALGNYVSALEYGPRGDRYGEWWERSDERVHVIGKGILRFQN